MTDNTELLRACRASGQISDAKWAQHCAERPDLLDAAPAAEDEQVVAARVRALLEPRLVHLIAGLRHHQVEEAVKLLLDYIDARATPSQTERTMINVVEAPSAEPGDRKP